MNVYRGDIYYIENSKYLNIEAQGNTPARPGIIVSNDTGNANSDFVSVVYLTTQDNRPDLPIHVPVLCKTPSTALCETLCNVKQNRIGSFIRACTDAEMQAIDKGLMIHLGIETPEAPVEADMKAEYENAMKALEKSETERFRLTKELDEYRTCEIAKIKELDALLEAEKMTSKSYKKEIGEQKLEIARAQAEMGTYKKLYEQLLDRVMN